MEIRNLISFVHVAELNSFTKAAQVLGYSQSTISFQINHLTEEFRQNISNSNELTGHIHIVTPDSICEMMMSANYPDFYAHYPKISLKFSTADTDDMFRILDHNEADIIFTLDSHVYQQDYIIAKEERISTHFVTSPNSPFANRKNLSINDIIDQPFLLAEKKMGYRRVFDETLAKRSLYIQSVLEIARTDLITASLESGVGISFLPDFVTERKVSEGKLVYLDITDFEIDIWKQLIYHRNKWISKHFDAFVQYVMEKEFTS